VRDLDEIADLLMYHADNLQEALEVLSALRQLAFHLLAAIGEDPFKGFRPKQAETPEQDVSKPPQSDSGQAPAITTLGRSGLSGALERRVAIDDLARALPQAAGCLKIGRALRPASMELLARLNIH
jgi:hypothetical protein